MEGSNEAFLESVSTPVFCCAWRWYWLEHRYLRCLDRLSSGEIMKYLRTRKQRRNLVYGAICFTILFIFFYVGHNIVRPTHESTLVRALVATFIVIAIVIITSWLLSRLIHIITNWIWDGDEK